MGSPAIPEPQQSGVHELGRFAWRVPAVPGYAPEQQRPTRDPGFEYPAPTGNPHVTEREPMPAHEPARSGHDDRRNGGGDWLSFRHELGIAGVDDGLARRPIAPDRPAAAQLAFTVRPWDKGLGRAEFVGGLHGVITRQGGFPAGRQEPARQQRPSFRTPPAPWENTVPAIGG